MKNYFYIILLIGSGHLAAQEYYTRSENIVPNPSFEEYSGIPLGWFYKGSHFTEVMQFWNAATTASPDVFGPEVHVPAFWREKGFGEHPAKEGASMVGITVYGCVDGKPHCREYVQVRLNESLVIGQRYEVSFWTRHLDRSMRINNLGAHFSVEEISDLGDEALEIVPTVFSEEIIRAAKSWVKFSASFTAEEAAEFIIIGNFHTDDQTKAVNFGSNPLKYAYYYIDDVIVKKLDPILEVPKQVDVFNSLKIEKGKIIQLENIYFDLDKADFLPRSYPELGKLIHLMKSYPSMEIEIHGHTDNQGSEEYNQQLSFDRAKAVAEYLNQNQISQHRTKYKGFGPSQPIADNDTEEGRKRNRRVEFLIVKE